MTIDTARAGVASSYLNYLPAVYQQDSLDGQAQAGFLGRFLLAFEQVLTGLGDTAEPGIEEILDGVGDRAGVQRYFEPGPGLADGQRAPREFLQWLASWVALSLRADLDELRQRDFIARAVSLYKLRGTRRGLEELIRIYTRLGPRIDELTTRFQLEVSSTIGSDTVIGGGAPHFFLVQLLLPSPDPIVLRTQETIARAIIDMEKPAYTAYDLTVQTPAMQIGIYSTIGVDTLMSAPSSRVDSTRNPVT
jgi:phage tail-like protein